MKVFILLLVISLIYTGECGRRVLKPLEKTANVDFINMEAGGGVRPAPGPARGKPAGQTPSKASVGVLQPPAYHVAEPLKPPTTPKPAVASVVTPAPKPVVNPPVAVPPPGKVTAGGTTNTFPQGPQSKPTPGPGSVKQLINYYDSRGQASPIRPYSYSQAVKQGKPNQ